MLKQGETTHMQLVQMFKTILKPRNSVIASLVMVGVVASVLALAPTHGASNTLAQDCANPPSTPTFNYWPVTYDDVNTPFCHDFPAIDAAVDTNHPVWSSSEADWNDGLTMTIGQQGAAGMYIHNGAANNLPLEQTTAKNVHIITRTETTVGSSHKISVTYTADNAPSYTKSFTVHTPANAQLEVIPNTGFMYDYQGRVVLDQQNLNLGNSDFALGDLDACFEYSLFLTFKFKVVQATPVNDTTTLSIDKGVKNITVDPNTGRGAMYASSTTAKKDERVGYRVVVTNTGNKVAQNVTMTDNSVNGIAVDAGSTTVGTADDALLSNSLWQGAIPGTVNLGNLNPGESRVIKYTGRVTAGSGTLVNTATAVASNATSVQDTASVIVSTTPSGTPNLTIQKLVKNNNNDTAFADSVNAKPNEWVRFKLTITNTGNADLTGARITDAIPAGLQFEDSVVTDGSASFANNTLTVNFNSAIAAGQSKTVEFNAQVTARNSTTICNTGVATGNSVNQVQDNACVNVTVSSSGNPNISIKKYVKNNSTSTSYDDVSVNARTGERVNFKITVSNTGNATLNNVRVTDVIPSGLQFDDSVTGDGSRTINGSTFAVDFGSINAGQSKTVEFAAQVITPNTGSVCNIAKATGSNVSEVQDSACVNVYTTPKPGEANIVLSKKAFNNTKNVDAVSTDAARGDYITYTLVTTNNGTADKTNYVISDDLSQVLPLADMVSTNGGTVSGNTITYPAITIKAGETVTKTFQVRIKQTLSSELSYTLTNSYGNTIVIKVPGKTVYEAPKTGAAGTSAAAFAGLVTAGFVVARKRDSILKFIFA